MGTGHRVVPNPGNLVVSLLAQFKIPLNQIVGIEYKGDEFQDLDVNRYKDYTVIFFGVTPDKGLPTRLLFERGDKKILDICHIIIHWQDIYDASLEASWSEVQRDYIVMMRLGRLDRLNSTAAKRLADGLQLLRWIQERMLKDPGRPKGGIVNESNKKEAFDFLLSRARAVHSYGQLSKHRVARAFGGNYNIRADGYSCIDKCAGCKAIDRLIKQYNPEWTWRDNVLPLIKGS